MRALAAPVLSHLDPDFVPMLDDVRASLQRVFRADSKSLTLATSGTGTSAMEGCRRERRVRRHARRGDRDGVFR
jgi:aspartate aminotransferase-like enzyme